MVLVFDKVRKMKKFLLLFCLTSAVFVQRTNGQEFHYGFGYAAGFSQSVPSAEVFFNSTNVFKYRALALGYVLGLDAVLLPLSDETSLGVHASPSMGLMLPTSVEDFTEKGISYFVSSPLLLQYNWGNFSSTTANKEYGLGLGLGATAFYVMDFLKIMETSNNVFYGKSFLLQPTARLSFRFWTPSSVLYTLNLSHSLGSETFFNETINRSTTMLTLIRYSRY